MAGDAIVARSAKVDRDGDYIPAVALSYNLASLTFQWKRNWRATQPDDPKWEDTDWAGAVEALGHHGADTVATSKLRDVYVDIAKAISATGV